VIALSSFVAPAWSFLLETLGQAPSGPQQDVLGKVLVTFHEHNAQRQSPSGVVISFELAFFAEEAEPVSQGTVAIIQRYI
jgi:hypothetical protein